MEASTSTTAPPAPTNGAAPVDPNLTSRDY